MRRPEDPGIRRARCQTKVWRRAFFVFPVRVGHDCTVGSPGNPTLVGGRQVERSEDRPRGGRQPRYRGRHRSRKTAGLRSPATRARGVGGAAGATGPLQRLRRNGSPSLPAMLRTPTPGAVQAAPTLARTRRALATGTTRRPSDPLRRDPSATDRSRTDENRVGGGRGMRDWGLGIGDWERKPRRSGQTWPTAVGRGSRSA